MPEVVDPKITPTWQAIYECIRQHWLNHGYAPSQSEIMRTVGCSQASVQNAYKNLKANGHITRQKHEARSARPVDMDRILLREAREAPEPVRRNPWDDLADLEEWERS